MTVEERLIRYNQEATDNLFEPQPKAEKFEGFISIFENKKDNIMNKEKQYLELIKIQEQIIKELKKTNLMYFFVGISAGIFLAHLIFLATTIIK
ncbi:dihydroorotase [Flavobacterium phage vB_FspP_elemoB_14-3B]|uniref:Dihydroorotase n=1 Tax=Flavobacterium phage vB_FspP_elemoB_14-3B TaxID=2743804 RepID=A0A7D7F1T1_9CAUD|nr:dihydroorotase [Flavobacterium phage vB_FspP_elemoB_14-3B]QMP84898.1 dihydroorotase [Flavobacterium phage vB_FspP_elemoB_14-3B]